MAVGKRAVDSLATSIDSVVSPVIYEAGTAISAYQQRPPGTERSEIAVGDQLPLHATAADERQSRLDTGDRPALTEATFTDATELAEELAGVRDRPTAFEDGEYTTERRSVAAPVLDGGTPIGAVAVSRTQAELDSQRLEDEIPGIVVSASRSVENAL
jgi:DNA-binding IclR family transcriptional regulator